MLRDPSQLILLNCLNNYASSTQVHPPLPLHSRHRTMEADIYLAPDSHSRWCHWPSHRIQGRVDEGSSWHPNLQRVKWYITCLFFPSSIRSMHHRVSRSVLGRGKGQCQTTKVQLPRSRVGWRRKACGVGKDEQCQVDWIRWYVRPERDRWGEEIRCPLWLAPAWTYMWRLGDHASHVMER